ncbi:unnamed protein product [Rhizophagus irregularis]|nr:unnamed protein product [Rhizophagus irregularis]
MPDDIVFEWIPYGQFNDIKEIGNGVATAVWEDGPLYYKVIPKVLTKAKLYLTNASYTSDPNEFLNKVKSEIKDYSFIFHKIYLERAIAN